MRLNHLILIIFILIIAQFTFAQNKYTLSGIIKDKASNETLIGVNVIISNLQTGTVSNYRNYNFKF